MNSLDYITPPGQFSKYWLQKMDKTLTKKNFHRIRVPFATKIFHATVYDYETDSAAINMQEIVVKYYMYSY